MSKSINKYNSARLENPDYTSEEASTCRQKGWFSGFKCKEKLEQYDS